MALREYALSPGAKKRLAGTVHNDDRGIFRWNICKHPTLGLLMRKLRPRSCWGCGKPFLGKTFLQKYGSDACRSLGRRFAATFRQSVEPEEMHE